ncbi:pentatricopeptide (PPR) repeat protein [Trifolium pratense]|uniref:Pentatricopeptide (PPR) repeat protein n=1 Tax=Trifolium pratense TaxID=57577 RepID=A0A2K3MH95_TRIPR|nr:pentatricopeptide (PPR) repeat protein [Trifolium pratense]
MVASTVMLGLRPEDQNNPFGQFGPVKHEKGVGASATSSLWVMGVAPNVRSYTIVINGFCKIKMVDEAINLFNEMHSRKIIPNVVSYTTLIDGSCNVGRLEDALEIFKDLLVKGYNLNVYTYTIIIKGFCKTGMFDEALTMLSKWKTLVAF